MILVDDLIATGGTAEAAVKLLLQMGAQIVAACFVIDLPDLGGRRRLEALGVTVRTLVAFDALAGSVCGECAYARSNTTPSLASRSSAGVSLRGAPYRDSAEAGTPSTEISTIGP